MKLLLIDDNIEFSKALKKGLVQYNFVVDVAYNGKDGEEKAYINEYDVILLDLNLPDCDGLDILKIIRKSKETPLIIISARDKVEERLLGLDDGADDYICKPFAIEELKSRIHAVIRRFRGRGNPNISINGMILNPLSQEVKYKNISIDLTTKEFEILFYIANNDPKIISLEELSEHLYDEDFDPFSSVLRVHIARIKKKLFLATEKEILINMRGKGYMICKD